jgi:hypothetical protein
MKQIDDSIHWQNAQLYAYGVAFNCLRLTLDDLFMGFNNGFWMLTLLSGYSFGTWLVVLNLAFRFAPHPAPCARCPATATQWSPSDTQYLTLSLVLIRSYACCLMRR